MTRKNALIKDFTGNKFHLLTAIKRSDKQTKPGNYYWWFRCDCGKEVEILPSNVRKIKNGIKSCGCLLKSKHHGKHWLYAMMYDYRLHAKNLNMAFDLTKTQFEDLCNKPCGYCGATPRNGIDRLDSFKGYTIDNCISCCKICNYMKQRMTVTQFIQQCQKVVSICVVSSVV